MPNQPISGEPASFSSLEELESLLREGEESGEDIEMTAAEWQRLRDDVEADRTLYRKAS